MRDRGQFQHQKKGIRWPTIVTGCLVVILVPLGLFLTFHHRFSLMRGGGDSLLSSSKTENDETAETSENIANENIGFAVDISKGPKHETTPKLKTPSVIVPVDNLSVKIPESHPANAVVEKKVNIQTWPHDQGLPILGPIPTKGAVPLYGVVHQGGDAIFALACNYPKNSYQRFVGSLRKYGYTGDIVLAVSPPEKMKTGVADYVKQTGVVAYGFEVDCAGVDNCKLKDEFLGYADPRPHRTFANIRYALYEYWLRQYTEQSYILILDFRDTFFQGNPFGMLGSVASRTPKYDLRMFAENYKVKNIGICVFNSLWVERCFGTPALEKIKHQAVICSGSTMGSYQSIHFYVRTMLKSMDSVKCWLQGIESDQGYQNHLFYNGHFNTPEGNATLFYQGQGVVNTIGALNGYRVPAHMKGPLDTHWHIRDKQGYILNNDGSKSVCVHQWDRWETELVDFVDATLYDK